MLAISFAFTGVALVGRPPEEEVFFADDGDFGLAAYEADGTPEGDGDGPARPQGVPPDGSPLLEGQKRLPGMGRFVGERLRFEFGWRGPGAVLRVVAASAAARVFSPPDREREQFIIHGSGRTRGVVKRLWSMDADIVSVIDGPTGLVLRQTLEEKERRRHTKQTITFAEDGRNAERLRIRYHRDPGDDGRERLEEHESAVRLDAAALAFYLRNPEFTDAERIDGALFDGKYTYGVHLQRRRVERIRVQGGTFNAIRYRAWFSDVDRPKEEWGDDRVRQTTLWVSNDEWRVPLLFESDTFVGQVFGELVSWTPPEAARRR